MLNCFSGQKTNNLINLEDKYVLYLKNQPSTGISVVYSKDPYQQGHGIGKFGLVFLSRHDIDYIRGQVELYSTDRKS